MLLKKWPLFLIIGILMVASVGWNGGVTYADAYYEYAWDKYKGTEIKTYRLTPVSGRAGEMDQKKFFDAISKTPNVYGNFSGYKTGKTTGVVTKSVTDSVYKFTVIDFIRDQEPEVVEYINPRGGIPHRWNGTSDIRIFLRGSEATSLAELFYEGTPSEGRYHFNADDVYLVTFWSSTVRPISGMSAEALIEEGTPTFINRELVSQIKDKDPAAYPQNGTLNGYYYVYKGSEFIEE
ncbi:hypothetical protein [Paenibacillus terrae]|uniref:Uncharacterized protein n=1 Tax=Paenibacillus terrae TaxID=159743 RepID=A0A0D7WZV3_9BACL|nr:hypothetical protein [Paenibacillus terrae]KJD44710.1 hypothetical protein QD47_15855 [Paenibacillus terrae]